MSGNQHLHSIKEWQGKLDYSERSRILERGRNEVLKMAASGADISVTLNVLCNQANHYSSELFCSVLRLDNRQRTLHPIAAYGLPEDYCNALEGVEIGQGVGSCGTAAFRKERVIVEDIMTHPYWIQYKELALMYGLRACWSEPIIGSEGQCFGTFAMYYHVPKSPSEEDLNFIETSANLAAVVFESHENKKIILESKRQLERSLDERSKALHEANQRLEQALSQQDQLVNTRIFTEKMETTKSLVVGIAHELNTPIGVTVTSLTSARELVKGIADKLISRAPLKRTELERDLLNSVELLDMSYSTLNKANDLITRFKAINSNEFASEQESYDLNEYLTRFKSSILHVLSVHQLELDIGAISTTLSQPALSEMLIHLIENSILHGFKDGKQGLISLHAYETEDNLHINYQDNGVGISQEIADKVFEPFYVSDRLNKGLGLGLNVITNIVRHVFKGDIRYISSPVGARFEMRLPRNISDSTS